MAKTYRLTSARQLANVVVKVLLRLGATPNSTYLLTTRGRRSGRLHATPVNLVEEDDRRWLVAPYGPVDWVYNAQAAEQVTITRRCRSETVRIAEVTDPSEAARVLKFYVTRVPITRSYFDAAHDAPVEAFAADVRRHPVFRLAGPVDA